MLLRTGHKGQFVKYPKSWPKRMCHTGLCRFDTGCDMLVGRCACGLRHRGDEMWVEGLLEDHDEEIESFDDWARRTRCERLAAT